MKTPWRIAFATAFLLVAASKAMGEEKVSVTWAGVGFVTDHKDIARSFPLTNRFLTEANQACDQEGSTCVSIERLLAPKLATLENPSFRVNTTALGTLSGDSAIALALALDRELSSHEVIGTHHKLLSELSGQALFFDFKSMRVLASFPILLQHIDVLDHAPDEKERYARIAELLSTSGHANIHKEFLDAVSSITLKPIYDGYRVRVTSVDISETAKAFLPNEVAADLDAFRTTIAQELGKQLFRSMNIPLLPFSKGDVIGGKMSTRMADGRVYTLEIPEPDYVIEIGLEDFKKVQFSAQSAGSSWIYGAYLNVRMKEPLSGKIFINQRLKNGETKTVPATQSKVEDWPAYQATLTALIEKFSSAVAAPSEEWAKRHVGDANAVAELIQTKGVLEKCR